MGKTRGRPPTEDQLTPAEWRVVNALRHGLSNPAIAKRLAVSLNAVKYHVSNAMQKLGFLRREQLRLWTGVAQHRALARNSNEAPTSPDNDRNPIMTKAISSEPSIAQCNAPHLGAIAQIARVVSDIDAARRWYSEVAGLTHIYSFGKMAFFDCAGLRLMLTEAESDTKKSEHTRASSYSESILYFRVVNIHDSQNALIARGAVFVNAPHLVHRHNDGTEEWMAFFHDNEARPLALVAQVKPARATT